MPLFFRHRRTMTKCSVLRTHYAVLIFAALAQSVWAQDTAKGVPGRLPWEAPPRAGEPALRPPAGPEEVLARFDIGASQLEGFFDGQPLSPSEEDVLVKILFHFPRLGLDNLMRWRQRGVGWDQVIAAPSQNRAKVFHLSGRAKRAVKQSLLPEQAELYEFDHYYRVTLELNDSPCEVLLTARRIPAAWPLDTAIDEPALADALFLKVGDSQAERPQLVFAAERIAWHPDQPNSKNHIGEGQLGRAPFEFLFSFYSQSFHTPLSRNR